MRLNNNRNNLLQLWAMNFFFGRTSSKIAVKPQNRSIKNEDTVRISWRAKQDMLNEHIEKVENSGEPLTGVSYEEYGTYYYEKHGRLSNREMEIQYQQAVKGGNASLKQKEWRYNPEYQIPVRLYDSPEVTADREAAIEKYRRGEELTDCEKRVMDTFSNWGVRESVMKPAELERKTVLLRNRLSDAFSKAGIRLGEEDEITFEAWGKSVEISGNVDESTINVMYAALEENKITGHSFQGLYNTAHEEEAIDGGFALSFLRSAEDILSDEGSGVTVFDLSLDGNRNVVGLPKSLDERLKRDAVFEMDESVPEEYGDRLNDITKARYIREAFRSAVETIQKGDYDRLRAMTCKVTYKNGVLSC